LLPFGPEHSVFSSAVEKVRIGIYCTIISPAVLYECETWSLTIRKKNRFRLLGNRVLRRIFGPKGDEVTGGWREFHKEELPDLYSSPRIIRLKSRRI
jgi:hypothetical protein